LDLEVQKLWEFAILTSKLADLEHDVHVLNKSIELAQEETRLATKAKAQARQEMELAQREMLEAQ